MPRPVPDNPDAILGREQAAEALTALGFPVKAKTLATKASRGGGPPYQRFGVRALYRWGDALAWAYARLSKPPKNILRGTIDEIASVANTRASKGNLSAKATEARAGRIALPVRAKNGRGVATRIGNDSIHC
jgi:hypothetical protein